MVINRDKHNKFFTIGGSTGSQDTNDSQNQPSGDNNSNTGSSTGSTGGSTTIIYQGGGMTENQSNKLNGIEEGAEKNQDAFSYITIQGATSEEDVTLSADDPTDTFKLAAKNSITLSLEDDVITIGCDGVKYLKELLDVDAENPLDEDLLIYNSETQKWEAINPQFATIEWVNEQFDKIIGSAPEVLDTIYEIAEALGNDPDYVKDIANNLSALTNRVTITEQDITDIKSKLLPTNFTDLTSGQLLQYDGQYWVNVDKDAVGLNEEQLLEYLTANNYAKKSDITWSNLIGKPSIYATNIANITDLNSGWDSLLANAPTAYITRWPNFSEIGSKPTTLVGYGITDGVNSITTSGTGNVITGATISGHVLTLSKGITAITSVSLATINDLHANWDAILKVAPTAYVTRWPSWTEVTNKPDWIESDKPSYSWSEITGKPSVFVTNIANITDLHSTWDAVLKAQKPNWLTTVSLATITDLHANWDAILKAAPTSQVTRWPTWAEVTSKPSTLSGYGITDGVNAVSITGSGNVITTASISGHTLTLSKGITALTSVSIATISDLHSSWDAVLKAQKPAWITSVSLATISDLNASWDALLKVAPSAYVTRWPAWSEVTSKPTWIGANKPSYAFSEITGKPTTLSGYGITNAYTQIEINDFFSYKTIYNPSTAGVLARTDIPANTDAMVTVFISGNPYNGGSRALYSVLHFYNYNSGNAILSVSFQDFGWSIGSVKIFNYNGYVYIWLPYHHMYTSYSLFAITTNDTHSRNRIVSLGVGAVPSTATRLVTKAPSITALTTDNVASATKLQTARTINGTSFDGTANITTSKWGTARTLTLTGAVTGSVSIDGSGNVSLATAYSTGSAGPLDGRYALKGGSNATGTWPISISVKDIRSTAPTPNDKADKAVDFWFNNTDKPGSSNWYSGMTVKGWTDDYIVWQLASDAAYTPITDGNLYFRSGVGTSWNTWKKVLDSTNYTNYTVTKTGGGASGTWGISITGNAATATNADTLDGRQGTSYGIMWGGMNTDTDKEADDTTSTSITDFLTRLNYSGIFGSRFGAMRGSWYYVGNTQYNTGVGTLEMAGTAVLNMSAYANTSADYKTLLFLEGSTGNMYSYVSQQPGTARWSRYAKTTDNVASATKLATARTINGTNFDGTANITTAKWGTARNIYIRDASQAHTGTAVSVDGSANEYLLLPSTITATLNGNASTASKWATARTLTLTGDATGSASMDGSANVSMSVNVVDSDKLDGYHETSFFRSNISTLANETITNIPANRSGSYTLTHSGWNGSAFVFYAYGSNSTMAFMIKGGQSANVNLLTTTDSAASKWTDRGVLLTTSNYTSTLDSRYVNISGDTMTGLLTVKTEASHTGIKLSNTYLTAISGNVIFQNNNSLRFGSDNWDYNTWAGLKYNHSSKYIYLGLADGSIFQANSAQSGGSILTPGISNIFVGNNTTNKVWHAGNDGSGSGLDADLLDGTHKTGLLTSVTSSSTTNLSVAVGGTTKSVADLYATYLDGITLAGLRGLGYAMQVTTIDASSLDEDTWYPVTINLGQRDSVFIALIVSLDSGTKPSWSTHNSGFSVRKVWYSNGSGWGTNQINRMILFSDYSFADTDPVRGIGQMSYSSNEYVYVRGGGKYRLFTSHAKTVITLHTSTYTVSEQSVSPTTTAPAAIVRNNAYTTDNVYSATRLQTARTIWGQSFNGTANVSGNMTGVGSFTGVGQFKYGSSDESNATYGKYHRLNLGYHDINHTDFYEEVFNFYNNGGGTTWAKIGSTNYFNGNVGIGTTSPSYKLHVVGTSYFSGAVTAASSITASSYIYTSAGWFQNNKSACGLYNSAVDARWYASANGWYADKKITASSGLSVLAGASITGDLTIGASDQILRQGRGTYLYNGRDGALIRTTTYPGYNAILSAKTTNGSWQLGTHSNDLFYFTYVTDANYNTGTNTATYNITLPKKSGTIALTSDIPSITDVVTGNAGSPTQGVYISNNEVKAMSYSLSAHVSTGITGRLAYYMGNTNLTNYSATVGSQSKPIYINQGVPAACTDFHTIPHYGKYYLNSREATYSTVIDNYAFIRSIVRQAEGQLLITVNIPVSVRELSQIFVWGVGRYTHIEPNADGGCYVSIYIINSTQMRVTVHDDASANDGYFYLHFLAIG